MVNYLKKSLLVLLAFMMLVRPFQALGVDLASAFGNLLPGGAAVSVNSPGRFQSGVRNTFSAGGFDMRVPRGSMTPALISFTPPHISAGCNGISAHFGGLSFISGKAFEDLIKQLGTGAIIGFVVQMAIKIGCPFCEDIINKLRQAAELAAKLSMDGCNAGLALGKMLANSAYDSYNANSKETENTRKCGDEQAAINNSSDALAALTDRCKSLSKAFDYGLAAMKTAMGLDPKDKTSDAAKTAEARKGCEYGMNVNATWQSLRGIDDSKANPNYFAGNSHERKLLMMNLLGVVLKGVKQENGAISTPTDLMYCREVKDGPKIMDGTCKPRFSPDDADRLAGVIMCGTDPEQNAKADYITNFCKSYAIQKTAGSDGAANAEGLPQVYDCVMSSVAGETGVDPYKDCKIVEPRDFKDVFKGMEEGYISRVHKVLSWGTLRIASNASLMDGSAQSKQLLELINMAPFPLYQALNVSAVYPAAATEILNAMGLIMAQQLAVSQLNEMIRVQGRSGVSAVECGMTYQTVLDLAEKTRAKANGFMADVTKNFTLQQQIIEQIRTLNVSIQKEVLNNQMLTSAVFAQSAGGINATATKK